jgi:hypothetical protein
MIFFHAMIEDGNSASETPSAGLDNFWQNNTGETPAVCPFLLVGTGL